MKRCLALFLSLLFVFTACKKHNSTSPVPEITFETMTPDSIKQGASEDTVYIKFHLADGDADLGNRDPASTDYDIYIKDNRTDSFVGYFFPEIAQNVENAANGITGTCTFKLLGALIYCRQDTLHLLNGDTTHFELYIKDRAGNVSNHITTPDLHILP